LSIDYLQYYLGEIDDYTICCQIINFCATYDINPKYIDFLCSHILPQQEINMVTSGTTTGFRNSYKFSNSIIIPYIENQVKYPHGKNYCINFNNFLNHPHFNFYFVDNDPKYSYSISFSTLDKKQIVEIISILKKLLFEHEKMTIWSSDKNNLMFLLFDHIFVDFLIENKNQINIINTGISSFFKKQKLINCGFHINDNMIDWYSGLNFYTCKYNKKHILPIFYAENNTSTNLLNLSLRGRMIPKGDIFEYKSLGTCECGKNHYDIFFMPHYKTMPQVDGQYFYDMEICELLEGEYYNLQFIQVGNKDLEIHYTGDLLDYDKQIIEDRCKMFDKIIYNTNSVFSINHKQPPFHKIYYQKKFL